MKKLFVDIKTLCNGFAIGVEVNAKILHIPIWCSWILSVILLPINMIIMIVWRIISKNMLKEIITLTEEVLEEA